MSFDSSRFPFNPWNDFSGVVMQQGRVQLDSDWNEWLAELTRRIRAGTLDIVGRAVYPSTTPHAFEILANTTNTSITIGPGRMYVDGLLVENHGLTARSVQGWVPPDRNASTPGGNGADWDDSLDELFLGKPIDYNQQPYYPAKAAGFEAFPSSSEGSVLAYLDVWQRELTFLQHPDLIEKAVAVDTTGRIQTVWRVRLAKIKTTDTCCTLEKDDSWHPAPSGGRLTTGVVQSTPPSVCCLTPNTGYTGMENQLYRIEIQQSGQAAAGAIKSGTPIPANVATFKWSRDNASAATVITGIANGRVLTVQSTGKDDVLRFADNDWVEMTDDYLELTGQPGELHQIAQGGIDNTAKTVTLSTAPTGSFDATDETRHTRLVRWNQRGKVFKNDGTLWIDLDANGASGIPVPPAGTTLILENGITVTFDLYTKNNGQFNAGDYWAFAARTIDGTVESLVQAPSAGIHHHYARLAMLKLPVSKDNPPTDCRIPWPPCCESEDCCTAVVRVGDDIQDAINSLPKQGGCVCLKAGIHVIPRPLRITGKQNIVLQGECSGTIVQEPTIPFAMAVEHSVNISVNNIAFQGTTKEGFVGHGLIDLKNVNRCSFRHCVISTISQSEDAANSPANFGFLVNKLCKDLVISDCRISGVLCGIFSQTTGLSVTGNDLAGPLVDGNISGGVTGIDIVGDGEPARIVGNLLTDFSWGVVLGQSQSSQIGSCIIHRNSILRHSLPPDSSQLSPPLFPLPFKAPLGSIIGRKTYGIVSNAAGCRIGDNLIQSPDPGHGGILALGPHMLLERNNIVSSVSRPHEESFKNAGDNSWDHLPAGLVVYEMERGTAENVRIAGNNLQGPQNGIAVVAESFDSVELIGIVENLIDAGTSFANQMDLTNPLFAIQSLEQAVGELNATGASGKTTATAGPAPFGILLLNAVGANVVRNTIRGFTVGLAVISTPRTQLPPRVEAHDVYQPAAVFNVDANLVGICAVGILLASVAQASVQDCSLVNNTFSIALDTAANVIVSGNRSSGTHGRVLVHCFEISGERVHLERNTLIGGGTGILSYESDSITIQDNELQGTDATGILVCWSQGETDVLNNRTLGCSTTGQSVIEENLVGTVHEWRFGKSVSVGVALLNCNGILNVEGCQVANTNQVAKHRCADLLLLGGAHVRVRECRITRPLRSEVQDLLFDTAMLVSPGVDTEDQYLCGADVSNNHVDVTLDSAKACAAIVGATTPWFSDVLFNGNTILQRGKSHQLATMLEAATITITGNRIRRVMGGEEDPALGIEYTGGLSYAGNVVTGGEKIKPLPGNERPTPADSFNVHA